MTLVGEKLNTYMRKYRRDHPEYCEKVRAHARKAVKDRSDGDREKQREYRARNYVSTVIDGKHVFLKTPYKRPKPALSECELCGWTSEALNYHHWDDDDPSVGLWLCYSCHMFAERLDYGEVEFYYRLKAEAKKDVDILRVEARMEKLKEAIGLKTTLVQEVIR